MFELQFAIGRVNNITKVDSTFAILRTIFRVLDNWCVDESADISTCKNKRYFLNLAMQNILSACGCWSLLELVCIDR
jgi:hypothetical protein